MRNWRQAMAVYLERPVFVSLLLGFSGGLPLLLVFSTLSAWLKEEGVSLTGIGLFSLASSAYALKVLWAPLVDRLPLPVLTPLLGQRRSWLVLSQVAIAAAMVALGQTHPGQDPWWTALLAVCLAFASATQDIVIDAYRIETLTEDQQGAGAANYVTGYRIALLVAGGGALVLADGLGWAATYAAMAGIMGVGLITVLASPEPARRQTDESRERDRRVADFINRKAHLPAVLREPLRHVYESVICPFADFMTRPSWLLILAFVALYKYGEALLGIMANPFYLDLGFTKTEIGLVSKTFGFAMTIGGAVIGGVLVARWGVMRALLVSGVLQCVANLAFSAQALIGHSVPALMVTISIENVTAGMATSAFVAYLGLLTNVAYTATQFALLTSLMAVGRTLFAAGGGWLAEQTGWVLYFAVTTLAAVPGVLILLWLMRRYPPPPPAPDGPGKTPD